MLIYQMTINIGEINKWGDKEMICATNFLKNNSITMINTSFYSISSGFSLIKYLVLFSFYFDEPMLIDISCYSTFL